MENYRVTLVQADLAWEDPSENRGKIEQMIRDQDIQTDALLLPEMFNTGFTMNSAVNYEEMDGETVSWMKQISVQYSCSVGGSLIIKEKGKVFNRFVFTDRDGNISFYDKRHLFFLERDSGSYTPGNRRVVISDRGLKVLLATCYDLRFPVWLRNRNDYDAIFLVANWPAPRREVWIKLLMARAIENQCYVAAVNRTGSDGNGLDYSGDSIIVDPRGNIIANALDLTDKCISATLSKAELTGFREKFPVWHDADDFELIE